jgi:hypothetical protein
MIDTLFGKEDNTSEVCSGMIRKYDANGNTEYFTIYINPKNNPDLVEGGQTLSSLPSNNFNRWRCGPPYNTMTARNMYGTDLPV